VDLFADRDTLAICERVWKCDPARYPDGLFELAKLAPPMPWMYTGGLENYPELVGELAKDRELWGNGPDVLRLVRDPRRLVELLGELNGLFADVRVAGDAAPTAGNWLYKPLSGSGGFEVRVATPRDWVEVVRPHSRAYLQWHIPGEPQSVVFGYGCSQSRTLGVSRQLVGEVWLHGRPFQYCGSVGPLDYSDDLAQGVVMLAKRLAKLVGLSGVWGVDYIATGEDQIPIEVNPRYTASAEVFDTWPDYPVRPWFFPNAPKSPARIRPRFTAGKVVGKAVYYAPCPITFPAAGPWDDSLARAADVCHRPDFADIPHPGDRIEPGQPVLTILTDSPTEADCLARLKARAADLDRLFGFFPPPSE
ncbi:MAG: ATP-grasp domain-containing protein, partial [Fimbriiglobus sp.]